MFPAKQLSQEDLGSFKMSYDYIRGLTDGEGCFSFHTVNRVNKYGKKITKRMPAFAISMNERDRILLEKVRRTLKLRKPLYSLKSFKGDGYNRGDYATLLVRNFGELKNIIVPLFYKKLIGYKALQFENWIERIGNDKSVMERYNLIYRIYKKGFYENNFRNYD